MQENLELLARAETWDNGKPIRETMAADLPLAIDHFRYFAGVIRAEEGEATELDANTVSINIQRTSGRRRADYSVEFPAVDGDVENRARARRRKLHDRQTGGTDSGFDYGFDGIDSGHSAAGRFEHRQRFRSGSRKTARDIGTSGKSRVHGRNDDRTPDYAVRVAKSDSRDVGTRRQIAEHFL